jgi:hypothetical protein
MVYTRYRRPLFVAETGVEADRRPAWLAYVGAEARAAMRAGVPLAGLCWYPIVSHPGWTMVDTAPTGSLATSMRRGSALGMSRWPANSDASRRSSVTCLVPWRERGGHRDL